MEPNRMTLPLVASAPLHERLFGVILPTVLGGVLALGLFLRAAKPGLVESTLRVKALRTEFVVNRPQERVVQPIKKAEPIRKPVDLTDKPLLSQPTDDKVEPQPKDAAPVRRVYGLRKVYARGIGSGGEAGDAVIGKLGNTLNAPIDTATATQSDIKGEVVSTTTVTSAPRFRRVVKPEYTKEMLVNKIEGVVKVKALVDIDGKVKKATALNDLGSDAARQALKATLAMEFEPAMREREAVAVWIVIPIRFVMLS